MLSTQLDTRNRFLLKQRRSVLAEKQGLQSDDGISQFATKLNSVIVNCLKESENEAKFSSLIKPFIDAVYPPQEIPESDSENVIAIAPNRRLVDFFEGYGGYVYHGEAAFDICIYYAPNFEKVDGAYCFWSVRGWVGWCVRAWMRHTFCTYCNL